MRFEPSGFTNNKELPIAKSICDYIFRWLGLKFLPKDERPVVAMADSQDSSTKEKGLTDSAAARGTMETDEKIVFQAQADAPSCHDCGSIMVRSGNCYKCLNCGETSGCS
jgi:ribonucleoside-diphosphate reductase alpha chain